MQRLLQKQGIEFKLGTKVKAIDKQEDGSLCGVRDGTVMLNPAYDPKLCLIYLSHIYMLPRARGTVMSYWLRISPVEIAVQVMAALSAQGKLALPAPDARGGFDVINPRHFPYRQPDFRDPVVIRATGNLPIPFMLLLRRLGRERQATLPISEAQAIMRLLYDHFATYCAPEFLANSLDLVLRRLEERAQRKSFVELLPLPTSSKDLHRLKKLFRYHVYTRYYPDAPETRRYLEGGVRDDLAQNPRYLDEAIAKIAAELDKRPKFVYGSRDKMSTWDGTLVTPAEELSEEADERAREALVAREERAVPSVPPPADVPSVGVGGGAAVAASGGGAEVK
jgi:hypothetical protein